jgi:HK97 family phage major capsid protein
LTLFNPAWSEFYANPKVSQFLLDQADFDVSAWLLEEISTTEIEYEGAAFISGNGVKKPKGILEYDPVINSSWEWGKLGYVASGISDSIGADSLIVLQHALKAGYRRNGIWLMNDTTASVVRRLKDGEGKYLWGGGLLAGEPETLLGKPVEIDDNMPDISAGSFPIAFGDFQRGYMIGDHAVGRRLLRDPYSEKGQVFFYQTKRVFGGVINFQAIKLLKCEA